MQRNIEALLETASEDKTYGRSDDRIEESSRLSKERADELDVPSTSPTSRWSRRERWKNNHLAVGCCNDDRTSIVGLDRRILHMIDRYHRSRSETEPLFATASHLSRILTRYKYALGQSSCRFGEGKRKVSA